MDKSRIGRKISRLEVAIEQAMKNRNQEVDSLRSEVNGDPQNWSSHAVGMIAAHMAKIVTLNSEILQIQLQIDALDSILVSA